VRPVLRPSAGFRIFSPRFSPAAIPYTERVSYRGRIAPSPTGYLHVGHARTFYTAFERCRARGGTLVLRDEDLDPERSREEYSRAVMQDLHWLGIRWDEGPDVGGPHAPYAQSERRELYLAAWERLYTAGLIYPCTCSRRDLMRAAQAPHEGEGGGDEGPMYPGTCRPPRTLRSRPGMEEERRYRSPAGANWRFQVPDGEAIPFTDGYFGPQRLVAGQDFGDFLVWRRDDVPAYQLAVVVDDHEMEITEVVRGRDLLVSTTRQILLYRALGYPEPAWYHCPLVLDNEGRRLAKRHDALAVRTLRQQGVTPAEVLGR